jgi:hypothetical protein
MANRNRLIEEKTHAVSVALDSINVCAAAKAAGVPENTLRCDIKKLYDALPAVLKNKKPGPDKKQNSRNIDAVQYVNTGSESENGRPAGCPRCGHHRIWKNGTYRILNWLAMLLIAWLPMARVRVQRWRCALCGFELGSPEREKQAQARVAWWQQVRRLLAFSRFKLGLSVRKTQWLIKFIYVRRVSVGFIVNQTCTIGRYSEKILGKLSSCKQKCARFLLYDETFPKMGKRAWSLGVAMCEYGLIRSVRVVTDKAKDITAQLAEVVGIHYLPEYFLTDLDLHYGKYMNDAGLGLVHLRDMVHIIRQIIRLFNEAVRDVNLEVPKGTSFLERKHQLNLKRRLLRKQLQRLLDRVFEACRAGNEAVCVLRLQGIIEELKDKQQVIQTSSVKTLAKRLGRFMKKYGDTINILLERAEFESVPKTTNALESKNSIFKPVSRIAKFFPSLLNCQRLFAGVALMENFDEKMRGVNQGTNAMQRAGINFEELGGKNFFEVVGLPVPQISIPGITP